MNYKLNFINATLLLFVTVTLFIVIQGLFAFISPNFIFCILAVMPCFIILFIRFVALRYNWNKVLTNIVIVFIVISTLLYWLILEFIFHIQYFPSKLNYQNSLNTLKKREGIEKLAHFPEKIPSQAQNYFMQIENSFDGYDMDYLSFEIDKPYIDTIFNYYKKDCSVIDTYRNLYDKGIRIYINFLNDNDKICLLKKESQDENYTSGIIFGHKNNKIYFFYSID